MTVEEAPSLLVSSSLAVGNPRWRASAASAPVKLTVRALSIEPAVLVSIISRKSSPSAFETEM